jgi:Transposase domain (DUF772)
MKLKEAVSWLAGTLQRNLIPLLEECWEWPLTEKERQLVSILELVRIEKFAVRLPRRFGRKPRERQALARALVAKAVYNHPHTRATMEALRGSPLFRRICGFVRRSDIPSEATFSRAFKEFAKIGLGEKVHQALVAQWVAPELAGHISRDAMAIEGREKARAEPKPPKPAPREKGRPCRGCLPISTALTAASLHDSQVAIPLMKLTSAQGDYLYDVMDAAYDAQSIDATSRSLGHVPIIDRNGRGREVIPLAPHEAARYKERTVAERFDSRLKEGFGGSNVMVRGAQKVMLHLMFGVIALFADQLLKLIN